MKISRRKKLIAFICFILIMFSANAAYGCTAIYVGQKASDDGTIIIGRSNDYQAIWPNYLTVVDRVENEKGRTMPVNNGSTVFAPIPDTTYKYTATPWMDSTVAMNQQQIDAACCTNEYGVAMTMSVTAFASDKALEADPLIPDGLTEFTADNLVICQTKTAREAVLVLTKLIDDYGSSESNIALISDQNEAWYVEMYTAHQYAAVKLPEDMVAVFGNEFSLEYLSDYDEYIVSENLESLAVNSGFAVYGDNGELNIRDTYCDENLKSSHMRTWIGHKILAPDEYGDFDINDSYPLTFKANKKVSLQDAMEILRNRYEGTKYSPDETGRLDMRVIGTDVALSVHVVKTYPELPAEMCCVTWESVSPAIYGVFVPLSNYCLNPSESYSRNQPAEEIGNFDYDTYPWYAFKAINTICVEDKTTLGDSVRSYWHNAETNMIKTMDEVLLNASRLDSEAGKQYVTEYCSNMQEQAFLDAREIVNDLLWYKSKITNTLKIENNPENKETFNTLKVYDPIEITMDYSKYAEIPEIETKAPEAEETKSNNITVIIIIIAVLSAVELIYLKFFKKKK